ncbi:SLBB domain-containing protein [Desulfobacter vibrioformis]|uniref:SLBB domain-containing protein n=1 Tax=Desulfobacter vibrioformis TaxID=34031 RepID=UPI00054D8591|nr:SLBB domain-containing protein [Desulfobacter vibrioformis]
MIKKSFFFICFFVFAGISWVSALEFNGQTISSEQLNSLPPEIQQKLEQDTNSQSDTGTGPDETEDDDILRTKAPRLSERKVSKIETQYRDMYQSNLSKNLKQYGYGIFNTGAVKPSSLAVPDENYVIGTGDELLIRIWGSGLDASYPARVDRNGNISLPKIGVLKVAGVTYKNIETIIQNEANNYIQGITINVTFARLHSLEVYVVGAVQEPGLHIVPAFSTIFDGLMAAGGVYKKGTLRRIQLKRNDRQIQLFDLYDLLFKGERTSDIQLENKDVIFVPGIGETVAVAGAVNDEGIFETNGKSSIKDIVSMAGGVLPQAWGSRIYLRRFKNNREFVVKVVESQTELLKHWESVPVQNGDLVDVTFFQNQPNLVYLTGHVWKDDIFQYKDGLKLSDILISKDLLKTDAMLEFAFLNRYNPDTTRVTPIQFPLGKVFSKEYDAELKPFDQIQILSRQETGIKENFNINGAVRKPGRYELKADLTLKDAIALAGGIKFGGRKSHIELARQKIKNNAVVTEYSVLNLETDGNKKLMPFDSVLIPMLKDATLIRQITITGEVGCPGTYTISEGENLSDIIKRAGGFTPNAYLYGAKYTSEQAREIQQLSINNMIKQLELEYIQMASKQTQEALSEADAKAQLLAKQQMGSLLEKLKKIRAEGRVTIYLADLKTFAGSSYDYVVKDGDTFFIPEKPYFVSVVGSVYMPGSFLYQPNQTLETYLDKSGGLAKGADEKHVYLMKANGEILSAQQAKGLFSSNFEDTVLMPGDTIVVPENLEKIPYLKLVTSITDIVFKIAVSAGIAFAI